MEEEAKIFIIPYYLPPIEMPTRLSTLLDTIPVKYYDPNDKYSWNPNDCSENIYIKTDDSFTCHRNPVLNHTDAIRGKTAFTEGINIWEIFWPVNKRGTHASVGVATAKEALQCHEYKSLIGSSNESWGWSLVNNMLHHGNDEVKKYPAMENKNEKLRVPENIIVILNMEEGTLSFSVEGAYLSVAFSGLRNLSLYPAISTVHGHSEITLKYIGSSKPSPFTLEIMCKYKTRGLKNLEIMKYSNMSSYMRRILEHFDSWYLWIALKVHPENVD